ncbi:MAG TPA: M14 family metallopeptidase, partial [Sediminibacterium sp.]|nr:M14 family metallopeptidase [Sediminibacterium sp.]
MNKIFLTLCSCIGILISVSAQQLKSPEQYLGYPLGSHYTRHQEIVGYFQAVAAAEPEHVQLIPYGKTNEGRELLAVAVSSAENIRNLESIRKNNMRLTGILSDGVLPDTVHAPVIVWLSYNVHGNEPSSSEAALQTLFRLADPSNQQAVSWLQHTVVILDPCINPDGRDRSVNWFNSVVGASPNPDPASREHTEPWPGGRTNHYNFDLNRDWAWQTQIETRQRMKLYNEWLPQVHVDFHEQGINEPYYFAPAANPYHLVITPWQRRFQEMIGKNNAKYFDENGWLFFTKERFDLLYPSYGDTYPLYNGAIGMTFEQGGGSRGGLAVIKGDGDTLTLSDRLMHHYITGMSTVETAASHRVELLSQFTAFYRNSLNGQSGGYATYVLTDADENKIRSVVELLQQ